MTNTSSPRTFSWISTKISMSEKRRTLALVRGKFKYAEIASARGRLLLPIFRAVQGHTADHREILAVAWLLRDHSKLGVLQCRGHGELQRVAAVAGRARHGKHDDLPEQGGLGWCCRHVVLEELCHIG